MSPNPRFQNLDRPAYELPWLLRDLPKHVSGENLNTGDLVDLASAAESHARNACGTILDGLETVGRLLFSAGDNENFPISGRHLCRIGALITHLAVEAQFLDEQRGAMAYALAERAAIDAAQAALKSTKKASS